MRAVCTCACFWTNVHAFYKRVTKGAKRRRGATLNRRPTARRHYLSNSRTDSFEPFIHHSSHPWPILSPCWYMLVHAIVALSRLHSLSFTFIHSCFIPTSFTRTRFHIHDFHSRFTVHASLVHYGCCTCRTQTSTYPFTCTPIHGHSSHV